ncbi:hypothetical protein [Paraburkholderia fungorum]|uniref:hypothetical protein n=1 Tax=Paraburkholderia fungorum TaxID=134537 RepID=UPI00115F7BC5|nr:hypothetical protein [Paraburkholderia fungorum]
MSGKTFAHNYAIQVQAAVNNECTCPPTNALPIKEDVTVFRWTFNPLTNQSFVPQGVSSPTILNKKSCEKKCAYFSLSFYKSELESRSAWKYIKKNVPNFHQIVGDAVAKGHLEAGDGLLTPVDKKGHVELHEDVGNIPWQQRFTIIGTLP